MPSTTQLEVGQVVTDKVNGSDVIITRITGERADEVEITYDFAGNPVTVHDENEESGFMPSDTVVEGTYVSSLGVSIEGLSRQKRIEKAKASNKTYHFPHSRLTPSK